MSELDKIEQGILRSLISLHRGPKAIEREAERVKLLARAVRQLSKVYSFDGWRSMAEIDRLDPDVLALLEKREE